jgi:hypothetical protein
MKILFRPLFLMGVFLSLTISLSSQVYWNTTLGNALTPLTTLPSGPNEWLGTNNNADLIFKTNNGERLRITSTGLVGINNLAPAYLFDLKAPNVSSTAEYLANFAVADAANDYLRIQNGTGGNSNFYPLIAGYKASTSVYCPALGILGSVPTSMDYSPSGLDPGQGIISFNARRDLGGTGGGSAIVNRPLFTWSNYTTQYMTMLANGKVGIKTILPTADLTVNGNVLIGDPLTVCIPNTNYKLFVQTGILTEKVKVAVNCSTDWSDYVFDEKYELKGINELEAYLKIHKHLPNIPSADDVVRDGVDLGQMDAKLLEKIEELTLYLIQQNKKIEKMQEEIDTLKKK